jgi:uncharacterized spore protein YtfJ
MSEREITIEDPGQPIDMAQETLEVMLETASVEKVYGEPLVHEGTMIIPTAEVLAVAGFGAAYGSSSSSEHDEHDHGSGGGAGGGGRTFSRPVAVIIADENGVRVEPVLDPTKIALTFITALGFMLATISRMTRGR